MGSDQDTENRQQSDQPASDRAEDEVIDLSEIRKDDGQEYLDRDKLDFDPDDGLYSGTAVDGTSEIPGPHDHEGDEDSITKQAEQMAKDEGTDQDHVQAAPKDEMTSDAKDKAES
ncbi:MAG: hypothetical protein JWP39_375 [Jatrophihabitans sp.]|nr:hypothetical protein [Jatrophihabitans sp.]